MKVRTGFVSNSSSSSFIILGEPLDNWEKPLLPNSEILTIPDDLGGKTGFGWEVEWSSDVASKLNFVIIQALYNKDKIEEIKEILKTFLNVDEVVISLTDDFNSSNKTWGYVDHQSSVASGEGCKEIFKILIDEEEFINFIFNPESKLLMGNDNEDGFDEEVEKYKKGIKK